ALIFGYAGMINYVNVGVNIKYISSNIDDVTATAFAADIGAQKTYVDARIQVGAAVQNLGSEVKFNFEGDPLPLNFRLGAKYALPIGFGEADENLNFYIFKCCCSKVYAYQCIH
ncbi:hypothetical protein ACFL58_04145, partial [Elusimicrobiota bacterium]